MSALRKNKIETANIGELRFKRNYLTPSLDAVRVT